MKPAVGKKTTNRTWRLQLACSCARICEYLKRHSTLTVLTSRETLEVETTLKILGKETTEWLVHLEKSKARLQSGTLELQGHQRKAAYYGQPTNNAVRFRDPGQSSSRFVAIINRFQQSKVLTFRVHHRILTQEKLRWFRPVNLQHSPVLLTLVPSN